MTQPQTQPEKSFALFNKLTSNIKLLLIISNSILIILIYSFSNLSSFTSIKDFNKDLTYISLLSVFSFYFTFKMIPPFMEMFLKKGKFGVDINKTEDYLNDPNKKIVPESLGLVPSVLFLVSIIFYIFLFKSIDISSIGKLASILVSIAFMILLGFVDDILDLRWRYKLILPAIASIPIVIVYSGETVLQFPKIFEFLFIDARIDIGILYKVYISMLSIFCTNAINIYAGINGLEVGQSIIITLSMILYNLTQIVVKQKENIQNIDNNVQSLFILIIFLSCILPLFIYNSFPSDCFIGDTLCYFAGITLACASIIGEFEITVLLFFIPQILNFLISLPQLIGIIPCPRHRLPTYSKATNTLKAKPDQLNLLNQGLRLLGPTTEKEICNIALLFQIGCSVLGFYIRYCLF